MSTRNPPSPSLYSRINWRLGIGPFFPAHQHVRTASTHHLFHPKQCIVGHVHFLHILFVKGPLHGGAVPFLQLVGGHRPAIRASHKKHFFGPAGQIPFFERAMFLVQADPLSHLEGGSFLSLHPSPVQSIPHGTLVGACHSKRGHANASMRRRVVPTHQQRQSIHVRQRVHRGEHAIHAFLQGAIPAFHHRRLAIPMRGKMPDAFVFQKGLKRAIVKFFAQLRLQTHGLTPFAAFQNSAKRLGDTMAGLVFQRRRPGVFGQHVHHRQDETKSLVLSSRWTRPPNPPPIAHREQTPPRAAWEIAFDAVCARCTSTTLPKSSWRGVGAIPFAGQTDAPHPNSLVFRAIRTLDPTSTTRERGGFFSVSSCLGGTTTNKHTTPSRATLFIFNLHKKSNQNNTS